MTGPWDRQWEHLEVLGQGRTGLTWLVRHRGEPGRLAALKVLHLDQDGAHRHRFFHEGEAIARVRSPRVPRLLDSNHRDFEGAVPLFLVMEYVPGASLESVVRARGALPLPAAARLTQAILGTVAACHGSGIVHRDVTPENVVLRGGDPEDPVLLDFGAAWKVPRPGIAAVCADDYIGNRFLRLPELASGTVARVDPRSDLTLCAGLLLFALTGVVPSRLHDDERRPPHQRPEVAAALESLGRRQAGALAAVWERAFRFRLAERWQSVEELHAALGGVADVATQAL